MTTPFSILKPETQEQVDNAIDAAKATLDDLSQALAAREWKTVRAHTAVLVSLVAFVSKVTE